jgi:hemin uptake protein HemP
VTEKREASTHDEGTAPPKPRITSAELLRGARELVIQHGADEYRLRLTSKLKLILTK